MFAGLTKLTRDLLTEDDAGTMFCPVRCFGAGGFGTFIGNSLWQTIVHGAFDAMAFGAGLAAIITALGAGIGVKKKMGADTE